MSKRTGIKQEKQAYVNQVGLLASTNISTLQKVKILTSCRCFVFLDEMLTILLDPSKTETRESPRLQRASICFAPLTACEQPKWHSQNWNTRVAVYLAGYMRSMGRCRSAHDKTFHVIAKVRYCTWYPVFVKRDERECLFFTLENGMHKLDHTSWMMYVNFLMGIFSAAEDFAMLRR